MASLARIVRTAAPRGVRTLAVSAVVRKDLVQEIYINELKAYKPTPQPKDAHVGIVKEYHAPPVPRVQDLPTDLAAELAKYDATEPDFADAAPAAPAGVDDLSAVGTKEFLEMLEADPVEPHGHH